MSTDTAAATSMDGDGHLQIIPRRVIYNEQTQLLRIVDWVFHGLCSNCPKILKLFTTDLADVQTKSILHYLF